MNSHSNLGCIPNRYLNHNNQTRYAEHYENMDLCSQGKVDDGADNILSRMDKLRMLAKEQQEKRAESQRLQTSFCF